MQIETWLTFITVVFVFAIIPGPTVILVMGQAISYGRKSVTPLVAGVLCGDFVAMSLSLAGLGAILATSSTLYTILKWFGVVYLIYLGIKTWREEPKSESLQFKDSDKSNLEMFRSSFLVTALNPKDIIFFVAFLPQFVSPTSDAMPQFIILMITFLSVISITITSFAIFAGRLRNRIQSYRAKKLFNKAGSCSLIGAGIWASTIQRN
jgi:threonine/homoserine/homoserine lactone efflux protein